MVFDFSLISWSEDGLQPQPNACADSQRSYKERLEVVSVVRIDLNQRDGHVVFRVGRIVPLFLE